MWDPTTTRTPRTSIEARAVPFPTCQLEWRDSGFPNQEAIEEWQQNCCGIACARMVIDHYTGQKPRYWDLLQLGLDRQAYIEAGWIHKGLVDLIGTFGVAGRSRRDKTVEELAAAVGQGNLCIASVTVLFWGGKINAQTGTEFRKGGHLVVVHSVSENGLVCHHPSSRVEGNHQNWDVPWNDWETSFSGNFMEFDRERL